MHSEVSHNSNIVPELTNVGSNIIRDGGKYEELLANGNDLDFEFRKILVKEKCTGKSLLHSAYMHR